MRAELVDEPKSNWLRHRIEEPVARVRRYAYWIQWIAVIILILTLVSLTAAVLMDRITLNAGLVVLIALIMLATLGTAAIAGRVSRFALTLVWVLRR